MTPTLVRTPALDGAHTLDKAADHRKQQIQAAGRQQDLSHDPRLLRVTTAEEFEQRRRDYLVRDDGSRSPACDPGLV
jgi:hypothetical protein